MGHRLRKIPCFMDSLFLLCLFFFCASQAQGFREQDQIAHGLGGGKVTGGYNNIGKLAIQSACKYVHQYVPLYSSLPPSFPHLNISTFWSRQVANMGTFMNIESRNIAMLCSHIGWEYKISITGRECSCLSSLRCAPVAFHFGILNRCHYQLCATKIEDTKLVYPSHPLHITLWKLLTGI